MDPKPVRFIQQNFSAGWNCMSRDTSRTKLPSNLLVAAAASIAFVAIAAWRGLPHFKPTTRLAYGALLGSLAQLWKRHAALRRAALAQGLLSVGFSAFWSTLAVMLHGAPFHLGSAAYHPRDVLAPVLRNRAPLLPLALPGLATAAVAPRRRRATPRPPTRRARTT